MCLLRFQDIYNNPHVLEPDSYIEDDRDNLVQYWFNYWLRATLRPGAQRVQFVWSLLLCTRLVRTYTVENTTNTIPWWHKYIPIPSTTRHLIRSQVRFNLGSDRLQPICLSVHLWVKTASIKYFILLSIYILFCISFVYLSV